MASPPYPAPAAPYSYAPPQPQWQPAPQPAYAPGYAPATAPHISTMSAIGIVMLVLAIIASVVAFFLSEDGAYEWSAGIFLLSALLFGLAGVFFFWGRRPQAPPQVYMPPPGYGPRPP